MRWKWKIKIWQSWLIKIKNLKRFQKDFKRFQKIFLGLTSQQYKIRTKHLWYQSNVRTRIVMVHIELLVFSAIAERCTFYTCRGPWKCTAISIYNLHDCICLFRFAKWSYGILFVFYVSVFPLFSTLNVKPNKKIGDSRSPNTKKGR